jgi:hypothetical protein
LSSDSGEELKPLDVLVFIPLIPVLPVVALWFLPGWESWIARKVPRKVIGSYVIYCTFAVWYFRMPWWVVLMVFLLGTVVFGMSFVESPSPER